MGTMLASLAEGITLTGKTGLKPQDLSSILELGAMSNPMFKLKGPLMAKGDFPPNFPLKHQTKDLRFALHLGEKVGAPLPLATTATSQYESVLEKEGEMDFSAIIKATQ